MWISTLNRDHLNNLNYAKAHEQFEIKVEIISLKLVRPNGGW
jgi:hypothetical protein